MWELGGTVILIIPMFSIGIRIIKLQFGGNERKVSRGLVGWHIVLCWSHQPCFPYMEIPPFPLCRNNMLLFPRNFFRLALMDKEGKKWKKRTNHWSSLFSCMESHYLSLSSCVWERKCKRFGGRKSTRDTLYALQTTKFALNIKFVLGLVWMVL